MENSPGLIFWILSVMGVAASIFCVTAKRGLYVAVGLVLSILAILNLMITLGLAGLAFIYAFLSLVVTGVLIFSLKGPKLLTLLAYNLKSEKKQIFYFIISMFFFVGCLFLVSHTEVWQYKSDSAEFSFFGFLGTLSDNYLLPFLIFKAYLFLLLVAIIFNLKRSVH